MPGSPLRPEYESSVDMPPSLRNFVSSDEYRNADAILQKTYGLTKEQTIIVGDNSVDALYNHTTLAQAVENIRMALVPGTISEVRWKDFVTDFLKLECWPIRELYGAELTDLLEKNQIRTVGWPEYAVSLKPVTYSGAATLLASRLGFGLVGQQIHDRFRDLIASRVKDIRTVAQVEELLQRSVEKGGLGFDSETTQRVLDAMDELIQSVEVLSEDEYSQWLAEGKKPKPVSAPIKAASRIPDEDELEIAAISARMPQPMNNPQSVLDQAIETTFASLSVKPSDDYSAKRLRYIISSRLRDVRNPIELFQLLMRDTKVGGMGYDQETAEVTMKQIESQYVAFHSAIMQDEKSKLDQQMREQLAKVDERKQREAEEHAKWYKEKIESRKQVEDEGKQIADRMKKAFAVVHPMDAKEQATEEQRFGKMVPAVPPPVSPFTPPSVAPVAARPEVKISKATAVIQTAAAQAKPRLDDVKYGGPQLKGPIQELKDMTLVEFRRLSKDPEIAVQKIMQRLEVLRQEAFERRIEGIRAWQSCPLQKAYVELMSEAFQKAKPVAQLAEEKQAAGQEYPTPSEIAAIISLNSKLHF